MCDDATLLKLIAAQDNRCRKIARELHDVIGQDITALRIALTVLRGDPKIDQTILSRLANLEKLVTATARNIHHLLSELPVSTEVIGLFPAIEAYVVYWSDRYGIPAEYHNEAAEKGSFGPRVDTTLYRITQEALHNVAKHSRCSHVDVVISKSQDRFVLVVEDDGCGFDTDVLADADNFFVRGIEEMRTRATSARGEFSIESELAKGTSVIVKIPVVEVTYDTEI